jgi:hypothetical protein
MHKDAALIAQHRRPALLTALFIVSALTLFGCDEQGVDVTLVGIPADTEVSVSVDSLRQDIAAAPSKVYRYRGVGYAKVLGLVGAPSYTATVRRLDGCVVAAGSVAYQGEEEVRIDLHPVDGCKMPAAQPQPAAAPDLARPDMAPSDMTAPAPRDMAAQAPSDMAAPAVCAQLPPLPAPIAANLAPSPGSCPSPTRWTVDCQFHCPPVSAERIYFAYSWVLATDPLGYQMSRVFYATSTEKDVSGLSVGYTVEYGKCGVFSSHTYYNVVKQQLSSSTHGVTPEAKPLLCPGIKNGRLAPWEAGPGAFFFYEVVP